MQVRRSKRFQCGFTHNLAHLANASIRNRPNILRRANAGKRVNVTEYYRCFHIIECGGTRAWSKVPRRSAPSGQASPGVLARTPAFPLDVSCSSSSQAIQRHLGACSRGAVIICLTASARLCLSRMLLDAHSFLRPTVATVVR